MRKENPTPDFIELEKQVLKFWEDEKCFQKLIEKNKNGERFAFLDGPITANNPMGIHHAWGRTLKDMVIRYNAMKGRSCHYQNGFDSQGLWVEVETEKDLGIKDKGDILEYGMDKFTEKCMERVRKFSGIITEQSKRLGQWMDWDNSYFTNTDLNITSIWHFLKVCHEKGWLVKSHRPMPWCPRCGTSLSEHEMSGSYAEMEHLSIYAKLPIIGTNDKIVLWTTTPWTLTSNVALAINPEQEYVRVKVKSDESPLIVNKNAIGKLKGDIVEVGEPFKGAELVGKEYRTCFEDFECQHFTHKIVPWEDVDAQEGTGVVHIAPGCGAEDFDLGKKLGLPVICPINDEGEILEGFGELTGKKTTEIVDQVVEMLRAQNKLYKTEMHTHSYPLCWRCKTPVVFKLVDEWNIATDEIRPLMIEAANTVKWEPEYAGKRMVDWLNNMGDWNISRKRFYGLPLPFYPCKKCGHLTVIGSKEELIERSEHGNLDGVPHFHRPYIDKIKIRCEKCGELVERIPEVGDCWLDAGITPFSTKKYFEDKEFFNKNFPSELVIEMKEQIRLWFYSLLFMSVTLTGKAPYKQVVAHSSVVNEEGGKFSKTGKMIRFDDAAEKIGADPVRYLYAGAPVATDVRFGYKLTDEARRKMLGLWNIYIFFNLYAAIDNPDVENHKPDYKSLTHSDRWLLTRTNQFINIARNNMDNYRSAALIKEFEAYVDEVSNWYIRINRKRFWKTIDKTDQLNAYWCLYQAIKATIGIMAPIIPFMTEHIYQNTVRALEKNAPVSVHLTDYPTPLDIPEELAVLNETAIARDIIGVAQRMRNEAQIKVKQPLPLLYVTADKADEEAVKPLMGVIKDELNIKDIVFTDDASLYYDVYYTVNFRVAGAALKGEAQKLKKLVDALDTEGFRQMDEACRKGSVDIGEFTGLKPELFERHFRPKANFIVTTENKRTLALNTEIDENLLAEGIVRELIRQIQVLRKEAGFAVEQRIIAEITSDDETAADAITEFADRIKQDILANTLGQIENPVIEKTFRVQDYDINVKLALN
ncbi:MAG TPA: isoleucine--tRNA ligase [Clostridia bacterium]|jgi:isoleucyl-tRNA synthetase|nr:isoleucine--tRNA ligase [Clostridia bacterium]HOK82568.1 isoleucine--tRNA ligase [Clostridia bacterium]HOL61694.1 isoleucine--tRNA ligase [Clostridia bacterium]HPO54317.1 isoleucine--tRNA ligase [Clostridia bacterium]